MSCFRPPPAHTYDGRCLSWHYDQRTGSIRTSDGRIRNVRFACPPSTLKLKQLAEHRKGESALLFRDGKWPLIATCEVPEEPQPEGFVGVDRGTTELATTSYGDNHSGHRMNRVVGVASLGRPTTSPGSTSLSEGPTAWAFVNLPDPVPAEHHADR